MHDSTEFKYKGLYKRVNQCASILVLKRAQIPADDDEDDDEDDDSIDTLSMKCRRR